MRLLNTSTLQLSEFHSNNILPYAILSHTWGEEEVLYDDILSNRAATKYGYGKLRGFCRLAHRRGFSWVWIDTCCIDKSSSAELSEAINSMYAWYAAAALCIVYLEDVDSQSVEHMYYSRWFTRGWTLQELIAPVESEFYTSDWVDIGTKASLAPHLSRITGVPTDVLKGRRHPRTCCVAQRMSWASARMTTREEDEAYCLLGLFEVNMPLLYGEGRMSFIRLQEQILQQREDYSIFAWTSWARSSVSDRDEEDQHRGFLASSTAYFSRQYNRSYPVLDVQALNMYSGLKNISHSSPTDIFNTATGDRLHFAPWRPAPDYIKILDFQEVPAELRSQHPPEATARGIRVTLPVWSTHVGDFPVMAWIYCEMFQHLLCVPLRQFGGSGSFGLVSRKDPFVLFSIDRGNLPRFKPTQLYLLERDPPNPAPRRMEPRPSSSNPLYGLRTESVGSRRLLAHYVWYPPTKAREVGKNTIILLMYCSSSSSREEVVDPCFYRVYCGLGPHHAWCSIEECRQEEDPEAALERSGTTLLQQHDDFFAGASDRAVKRVARDPDLVMGAAMRKANASQNFTLEFGVWTVHDCPLWARYALNDVPGQLELGVRAQ